MVGAWLRGGAPLGPSALWRSRPGLQLLLRGLALNSNNCCKQLLRQLRHSGDSGASVLRSRGHSACTALSCHCRHTCASPMCQDTGPRSPNEPMSSPARAAERSLKHIETLVFGPTLSNRAMSRLRLTWRRIARDILALIQPRQTVAQSVTAREGAAAGAVAAAGDDHWLLFRNMSARQQHPRPEGNAGSDGHDSMRGGAGGGGAGRGGDPIGPMFKMLLSFFVGVMVFSIVSRSILGQSRGEAESRIGVSWSEFEHHILARGEVRQLVVHPDSDQVSVVLYPNAMINGRNMNYSSLYLTLADTNQLEQKLREAEDRLGISAGDRVPVVYDRLQSTVGSTVTAVLVALLLLALLSSMRSGLSSTLGGLSSFKRANFTVVNSMTGEGRGVKFSDVAGLHEAKQEVIEFVDYLKRPDYYLSLGAKVPKGALLLGPPGCGKTLLAKAVATEGRVPFLNMNGSEFIEMIGGLGAARVRDLFREARKRAPCIVYIDEIDAIGRSRGDGSGGSASGTSGEMEQTLNQLLVEMDGMSTTGGVIMLASTNRADLLDKALLRPGRFDRHITIDLPTLAERRQIFEHHLGSIVLDRQPQHYSQRLAQLTPGFSGADIMNVCNESALKAARDGGKQVSHADLEYAVERVVGGTEKRSHVLSAGQRRMVAVHESGHALVGWLLPHTDALLSVSIVPRTRGMLGLSRHVPSDQKLYTTEQLFDRMCMALGGRAAEAMVFNTVTDGAKNDLERVTKMAYAQVREYGMSRQLGALSYDTRQQSGRRPYSQHTASLIDSTARALVARAYRRTERLLTANREKLTAMADSLMSRDSLNYDDVLALIGPPPHGAKRTVSSEEFEGSLRAPTRPAKAKDDSNPANDLESK